MVLENEEIMAAAEARAAWQRTANRYFVQEDAKRAPKLASCPSTSSSTQQNKLNNINATNGQENPTAIVPLNWNTMNSNLPPDTRWWLQLQFPKDFTAEQVTKVEEEVESIVRSSTLTRERPDLKNGDCPLESPLMVPAAFTKQNFETGTDEIKTVTNISQQSFKRKVDADDYLLQPGDRLLSKKTERVCSDLDSPWEGGSKCEPWWRISDQDELASLVAKKSTEHIENCDLPRPTQTVPVRQDPFVCLESLDSSEKIFSSSISCNLTTRLCDPGSYPPYSTTSGSSDEKYWSSSEAGYLPKDLDKLHSITPSYSTPISKDPTFETTSSRDQLLEALCHSQTRAREAEIAAQKAYSEKEHIIKLFFRQASHLFAYKQWLHMLQLESVCLQLRIKEHQLSTLFPILPWMPLTGNETKKGKKQKNRCSFCKYAVIFAVGLGLAGAGLFLGWLLPNL